MHKIKNRDVLLCKKIAMQVWNAKVEFNVYCLLLKIIF